jgi:putative tricarboxylic transport membrane protein
MLNKTLRSSLVVLAVVALALVAGRGDAQEKYPTKPVQLVPAGDPGGGLDIHARSIERALSVEKMLDQPFTILNKGGGGGNIATAYMATQKGNGYALAINSNRVLLNPLMGTTPLGLKDMTPVIRISAEYVVWAVRSDSKYKSALEVLDELKKDPQSVVFGVGTVPSNDQFNILLPAKQKGIDFAKVKITAFRAGGDATAQLLGGHIPILSSSMSELVAQVDAGTIRVLAVSSPSKLDRLPGVPTWKDQGIDLTIFHWRGIFGPPAMPKIAYDYWNKKFADMVKTKAWKDQLANYQLYDAFLSGDEFLKQLEKDDATYHELLGTLGMLKK